MTQSRTSPTKPRKRRRGPDRRARAAGSGVALAATVAAIAGLSEQSSLMAATMRADGTHGWVARILLGSTVALIALSTYLFASRVSPRAGAPPSRALGWASATSVIALLAWSLVASALPVATG